tara:strand:- start:1409 stop:1678 length:270 start_codon:yes stop_codon:yes gene_type:complete
MNAIHVSIYGQVQGVGFRSWIKEKADKLKVSGWVRNASDGSVELFLQGDESSVNQLLSLAWEGPNQADVEDVLTQESEEDDLIRVFDIH